MLKILIYGLTDNVGGVESFLLNYISCFDLDYIQIDLISNAENPAYKEEFEKLGCNVYKVCSKRKNPFQFHRDMKNIFKNKDFKYDIMWVNLCSLANIDYLKYAKKYGVDTRIIHCHNGSNMFGKLKGLLHNFNKFKIESIATHYWTCSVKAAQWFYPEKILSNQNFRLVNNAINSDKFLFNEVIRNNYRKQMGLEQKFIIGNVGRLHFQKNQEFLIRIMEKISPLNSDVHLLIIGNGELDSQLKKYVNSLNLQNRISFLGARDDVSQLLQAMDLFVMPSRFEGLPVSVVEAQAAGIQCLLSDTITTEIKITNLVNFLPIDGEEVEQKWIEAIMMLKKGYIRGNMKKDIVKNNYEIKTEARKIQSFFMNVKNKSSDSI